MIGVVYDLLGILVVVFLQNVFYAFVGRAVIYDDNHKVLIALVQNTVHCFMQVLGIGIIHWHYHCNFRLLSTNSSLL